MRTVPVVDLEVVTGAGGGTGGVGGGGGVGILAIPVVNFAVVAGKLMALPEVTDFVVARPVVTGGAGA